MFYKIENKDCKVYQDLKALLDKEKSYNEYNRKVAEEVTKGLEWHKFVGQGTQCSFYRVRFYWGFVFTQPEKLNPKEWMPYKQMPGSFIPNKRTKAGKDIQERLNKQKRSDLFCLEKILNISFLGRESFKFPQIFLKNDVIVMFLDEKHNPTDENIIEITSKEFKEILDIKD